MAARFFLVLCVSALLVQSIIAYPACGCGMTDASNVAALAGAEMAAAGILGAEIAGANNFGGFYAPPTFAQAPMYPGPAFAPAAIYPGQAPIYPGQASIYQNPSIVATNGGTFTVSMASPIAPRGINLVSENSIDGTLELFGSLPLLATVAVEGNMPSSGAAGTTYSCGCGNVGISSESIAALGLGAGNRIAAGYGPGYGAAISGSEVAGINAGLINGLIAPPSYGCGCQDLIYY